MRAKRKAEKPAAYEVVDPIEMAAFIISVTDVLKGFGLPTIGPEAEQILQICFGKAMDAELSRSDARAFLKEWFAADQRENSNDPIA